jgi:SOS response regulatory protein OraA/RecX
MEEEFRLGRKEVLIKVREKIRRGEYREKELNNVLDYLYRHQITL